VSKDTSPIILAFSGGLDTSFCVPWLKENYGRDVITACVDTGGIDAAAAVALGERAMALGASEHVLIEAKQDFFETVIRHLIAGNVLRGQAYPLCVGAERGLQAERLAKIASERGATTVAHGCTAAGNDQVPKFSRPYVTTTGFAINSSPILRTTACHYRHKAQRTQSIVAFGVLRSVARKH